MLTNPALAKVINYNCDVFSTLKITRVDEKEDSLTLLLKNPNFFQNQRQFLWMYRFWLMFGSAYIKSNSINIDASNSSLNLLEPQKFEWDSKLLDKLDKLIVSSKSKKDLLKNTVKYNFKDGSSKNIPLNELTIFHDLANGFGNPFKGSSRIDALYKVLSNTENGLDAKKINLDFTKKFLVSGNYDPTKNLDSPSGLQNIEKEGIIQKLKSNQSVFPIKAKVDIKRFVDNFSKLQLDESYNSDLAKIGSMYNIPKDVLEAISKGSTYENQEKSTARHIQYSETPKAMDLLEGLCNLFSLNVEDYKLSFADNSFMKVFEKDQAEINKINAETLQTLTNNGAKASEVAEMLGINLNFTENASEG